MDIQTCLQKGYLLQEKPQSDLIEKEIREAQYDIERAAKALHEQDYKWCIIQAYYSMFHSGKAVCFHQGYREKKHIAVLVVLEDVYKQGKLEGRFVNDFKAAMSARESADYRYVYSKERAEQLVHLAEEFNQHIKEFLKKK